MINELLELLELSDKPIAKMVAWIITVVTGGATILNWLKRKTTKTPRVKVSDYFGKMDPPLRSYTEHFIPNYLHIERAGSEIEINEDTSNNSINYLIDEVLNKPNPDKFHLLEASTGIGKTTYMINLFLALTKRTDSLTYLKFTARKKGLRYLLRRIGLHILSTFRSLLQVFRKGKPTHIIFVSFNDLIAAEKEVLKTYSDKDKKENTIVIVDAMDEYSPNGILSEDKYYEQFEKDWNRISEELSQFKTCIISVREQFLNQKNPVVNHKIAGQSCSRIKLLPFDQGQALNYVKNRYHDDVITHFIGHIYHLQGQGKMSRENQEAFCIPLILSRVKAIMAYQKEIEQAGYTHYAIFKAIVQDWLNREVENSNIGWLDADNIKLFCEDVAYRFALDNNFGGGTPEDDLIGLTKQYLKDDKIIFANRERTLLRKNLVIKTDSNGMKSQVNHYQFVHRAFLEFFLVELALKDEQCEATIPFEQFSLAVYMFIKQRWKEKKAEFPIIHRTQISKDEFPDSHSTPFKVPVSILKDCYQFFIDFSNNLTIKEKLKSSKREEGLYLLEGKPLSSIDEFKGLQNIVICNTNFWDDSESRPFTEVQELIPYIKELISAVYLESIEKLKDKHLQCFSNIKSLEVLFLSSNSLGGSCLQYFVNSKNTLQKFGIADNRITDDRMFEPFDGISKLIYLDLCNNGLNGSCLKYFANSRNTLKQFGIDNNRITDDSMFKPLDGMSSLEQLYLGDNSLDGSCIQYFTNCRNTLREFRIHSNRITDDRMFEPLDGVNSLKELVLNDNNLEGSCLRYFTNSKNTLTHLLINENNIKDDRMFEPLDGADSLKELHLGSNNLDGSCLRYFANSKNTLTGFDISSNNIKDDRVFEPLDGINSLQVLALNHNNLEGNCLRYFANSKNTLIGFNISSNKIIYDRMFEPLDGADSLQVLDLGSNSLDGSCLRYFANSKNTLIMLSIGENKVINDRMFEPLNGAQFLRLLYLSTNYLNGSCLQYFANSKNTLTHLLFAGNNIKDDRVFEPLDGADSLKELDLGSNSLDGDCLRYFAKSKKKLRAVCISNNIIIDSNVLKPFQGADKLEVLYLENNPVGGEIFLEYINASKNTLKECTVSINGETQNVAEELKAHWNTN